MRANMPSPRACNSAFHSSTPTSLKGGDCIGSRATHPSGARHGGIRRSACGDAGRGDVFGLPDCTGDLYARQSPRHLRLDLGAFPVGVSRLHPFGRACAALLNQPEAEGAVYCGRRCGRGACGDFRRARHDGDSFVTRRLQRNSRGRTSLIYWVGHRRRHRHHPVRAGLPSRQGERRKGPGAPRARGVRGTGGLVPGGRAREKLHGASASALAVRGIRGHRVLPLVLQVLGRRRAHGSL